MSAKTGTSVGKSFLRVENMPCTTPDGKPTTTGVATLRSLKNGALSPEEVATKTGQPLFRVRSGLMELKNSGFVEETEEMYRLSKTGETAIQ
jgi:predicted Rossmann fold nucleotide-binding protein DprA/Smf involved in DNA uptake